jgi:glyoxylase-like metal-dependent hydrolase (beta-lactamase superfamily II)
VRLPRRAISITLALLVTATILAAYFAPYIYPEYEYALHGSEIAVVPKPAVPVTGRWIDDYFVVEELDPTTIAIGEPRYYQGNYSYLIMGGERAVLFDAGTGTRDIVPVVRSLTKLPITVIPSHLHFDHVGALGRFDSTALLDVPSLRARVRDSRLTLERYEFLGFVQGLATPTFRVDEWWDADTTVDLGNRRIRVLSTPGHTPTSVSLYDEERQQLFVGDFVYPGPLYAFLPGASRSAYLATTSRLLSQIRPTTRIYTAHMADPPAPVRAPVLDFADLKALEATLVAIEQGRLDPIEPGSHEAVGFFPRVFPVREAVKFATGFRWNNR